MTLQEALATNKLLRRPSTSEEFLTYEEYLESYGIEREDVLATDWEIQENTPVDISLVAAAWNTARAGFTGVKPAGQSEFYKKFVAALVG